MNTPTDPLPEPWEWYNYSEEGWAAYSNHRCLAWTFQPVAGASKYHMPEYAPADKTHWVVKSHANKGTSYEAVFPTREEATRYISVRAMLGTWAEKEEDE